MTLDRARSRGAPLLRPAGAAQRIACLVEPLRTRVAVFVMAGAALCGCASTQFSSAGQMPEEPLCQGPNENVSALILWGTQWRPDQKEPALREAAAKRGIETFFADSRCFANVRVLQAVNDRPALDVTPEDVRALAARERLQVSRVLLITVRELGPVLKVFNSLALLEGGTEVVFDLRSLDIATGRSASDFQVHWQRGGPWVIKGVGALDADMRAALAASLRPRTTL
jgi:hypothetical protein